MPSDADPQGPLTTAESPNLSPTTGIQNRAAALTAASRARDRDDLARLLDALGLTAADIPPRPCDTEPTDERNPMTVPTPPDHTLTASTGEAAGIDPVTREVALSMHRVAHRPTDEILTATGLTEHQLTALLAECTPPAPTQAFVQPEPTLAPAGGIEELLAWGEQHPAKGVQALAARARTALDDLARRRTAEQAVTAAEDEIARLRRQLAAAEARLKSAKTGKPTLTAVATAAATPAQTDASGKEELKRIRAWAKTRGHQVADRGLIPKHIREAYQADRNATAAPAVLAG